MDTREASIPTVKIKVCPTYSYGKWSLEIRATWPAGTSALRYKHTVFLPRARLTLAGWEAAMTGQAPATLVEFNANTMYIREFPHHDYYRFETSGDAAAEVLVPHGAIEPPLREALKEAQRLNLPFS